MARIAILNVKHSPNLGDGVIAECLEAEIVRQRPGWEATSIDLAGRLDYGTGLDNARGRVLRLLDAMPQRLQRLALLMVLTFLVRFRLRKRWREQMCGADGVILGGGQLIADADLNFPVKVNGALKEASRASLPLAIFGVGVARGMSPLALGLFNRGFARSDIVHVAVRDGASEANWARQFGRMQTGGRAALQPARCRDPGLLAGDIYTKGNFAADRVKPLVGLGIVNPRTLDRHSSGADADHVERAFDQNVKLASDLLASGFDVSLFTNGPSDDEEFLEDVLQGVGHPRLRRSPRPLLPRDLAGIIRSFDVVVAHRLHASILAYAFRIPHIGLSWDPKVQAFFNSVDRGQFVADLAEMRAGTVTDLVARAYRDGIDRAAHREVIEETREAVQGCLERIASKLGEEASVQTLKIENSVGA